MYVKKKIKSILNRVIEIANCAGTYICPYLD